MKTVRWAVPALLSVAGTIDAAAPPPVEVQPLLDRLLAEDPKDRPAQPADVLEMLALLRKIRTRATLGGHDKSTLFWVLRLAPLQPEGPVFFRRIRSDSAGGHRIPIRRHWRACVGDWKAASSEPC